MTTPDLSPEAVAKMLENVTPGPWIVEIDKRTWGWVDVTGPSINVGAPTRATDLNLANEVTRKADARFIAWAREAVPSLSARLAEVEVERDRAIQDAIDNAEYVDLVSKYRAERDALAARLAEVQALKERADENKWRKLSNQNAIAAAAWCAEAEREAARAEAAEAEVARLRGCISIALGRMHPSENLLVWNMLTAALTTPEKDATP